MILSLRNTAIILLLTTSLLACSSSRKIPQSEIAAFKSVIALYEAKYDYGMNSWWKPSDDELRANPRVQRFLIATNMANVNKDVAELMNISRRYCELNGGNFTHEQFESIYAFDVGTGQLESAPPGQLLSMRMKNAIPSFNCEIQGRMKFNGYIARRVYTTTSTGPNRGNDIIVRVSELL